MNIFYLEINFNTLSMGKEFYTVIQLYTSICKILKVVGEWVKYFSWYDNTWSDVYVKLFYTDSVLKLNSFIYGLI